MFSVLNSYLGKTYDTADESKQDSDEFDEGLPGRRLGEGAPVKFIKKLFIPKKALQFFFRKKKKFLQIRCCFH
jgi:hypothetical protein